MSGENRTTTDHEDIRQWAEARGGRPAAVSSTHDGDPGILRIRFPGYGEDEQLTDITWEEWFDKFDKENLALVYQEETADGETSTFNKLVSRESV